MAKRTSRWVTMPTRRLVTRSTTGMPLMRCVAISAFTSARVWSGWMVSGFTTMPDFELLHPADLGGLLFGAEVLVDDADAAVLRHGDGHVAFGDGVHRGGDQRDVEADAAGEAGAGVGSRGQDLGVAGNQQDVVEGEGFLDAGGCEETGGLPGESGARVWVVSNAMGGGAFPRPWRPHIGRPG